MTAGSSARTLDRYDKGDGERGAKMSSRHRRDRYDLTILQLVTMT
jgi:hypothetical protein